MATLLRVPEVAAGATEVVLSEWLVDEGAALAAGAPVVVVETEKAVVEIEADSAGVVLRRLCEPGTTVEVGSAYAIVGREDEGEAEVGALLAELGLAPANGSRAPSAEEPPIADLPEEAVAFGPAQTVGATPGAEHMAGHVAGHGRIFAAPLARRLLAEAGIALETVKGTGPRGRIRKRDAEEAIWRAQDAAPAPAPTAASTAPLAPVVAAAPVVPPASAAPASDQGWTDHPHSRLRRLVATRLTRSKQTVPHFYLRRTVRLDPLLAVRTQLNAVSPRRISVNDLVVRAVGVASRVVPEFNVVWTEEGLRQYDAVDVGVAVASERGLMTPVVRAVEMLSPGAVARRVRELVEQANAGTLRQSDLEGGCISVTNLGMFGVEEFDAIINPPQSAILAVGAAVESPVVDDGRVVVATTMQLTLSVDHRALDGALAARWMGALVESLDQPFRLLA